MAFFSPGPCQDPDYATVRDALNSGCKDFVELLWLQYEPYNNDPNFLSDARNHFHQRFWEMYLCVTMLQRGLTVEKAPRAGPDFSVRLGGKRIWFEAIAAEAGTTSDRVPEPEPMKAGWVRHEQVLLRYTSALADKRKKRDLDLAKNIISADDLFVVALNARKIPHAYFGTTPPFVVQAYLPFGPLTLAVNPQTGRVVDTYSKYRDTVLKKNGSPVSTAAFLDPAYCGISAVLHATFDVAGYTFGSARWGDNFEVLHNPLATHPLSLDLLNWCDQLCYREGTIEVVPRAHAKTNEQGAPGGLWFKSVLSDPEWTRAPEKKARDEAYAALAEIRKKGAST